MQVYVLGVSRNGGSLTYAAIAVVRHPDDELAAIFGTPAAGSPEQDALVARMPDVLGRVTR